MSPSGVLYRRRNWVGVIPFKILREMSAVGSTSHSRIRGIECCLEHLIRYCGLRSIRNSYGTHETALLRAEIEGTCEICFFNIKTPLFSSDRKGKLEFWGAIMERRPKYIYIYIYIYIQPWALFEEAQWSENRWIARET